MNSNVASPVSDAPAAPGRQSQAKPTIKFEGKTPDMPFELRLLLFLQRFAASILPAVGGAYLITDGWYPLLRKFRTLLDNLLFPEWFGFLMFAFLLVLGVAFWLFATYDIWRSFQLVGEWQRLNVYRRGKYKRCLEKGFVRKVPLFESWGKPIDLRIRVARWQRNLVVTADDYVANPEMTIRYKVSDEQPWRSETDVEDFDELVLTSAESAVPTMGSEFTLKGIQSEEAEKRLTALCQAKVEEKLGTIFYLSVTDAGIASETQTALNARATLKAQAEGILEAASSEEQIGEKNKKAAMVYYPDNQALAGKLAERLRMWQFLLGATGGEGKSTYVLPSLEGLFRSEDSDRVEELVKAFTDQLAALSQPKE